MDILKHLEEIQKFYERSIENHLRLAEEQRQIAENIKAAINVAKTQPQETKVPKENKPSPFVGLTVTEERLVKLIGKGLKIDDIAKAMGIKRKTAETHRHRIIEKLKLKGSAELMYLAVKHGVELSESSLDISPE
jgi:DNA-binding NarL/FixJ family response regulator